MGITKNDCSFLFYAKGMNVSYKKTLMLGRLHLYTTKKEIQKCIYKYKNNEAELDEVLFKDEYSEPLFKILGAETVDSLDFSAYEKATIIHDLNNPIDTKFHNYFSCIMDGGTIEHVFNFPVAIQNCMKALKIGGHYIGITPTNNQMGHGFYQFSPELYFRIFSKENGFRIKKMLITFVSSEGSNDWYEVSDPKEVNSRVMLVNNIPLSLMFIAEKTDDKIIFEKMPQQIDYVNTWDAHQLLIENKKTKNISWIKYFYRKFLPKRIKIIARNIYDIYTIEKVKSDGLGYINPKHFKKIERL